MLKPSIVPRYEAHIKAPEGFVWLSSTSLEALQGVLDRLERGQLPEEHSFGAAVAKHFNEQSRVESAGEVR